MPRWLGVKGSRKALRLLKMIFTQARLWALRWPDRRRAQMVRAEQYTTTSAGPRNPNTSRQMTIGGLHPFSEKRWKQWKSVCLTSLRREVVQETAVSTSAHTPMQVPRAALGDRSCLALNGWQMAPQRSTAMHMMV
ncbi:hypothetical protein EYF80_052200 [Liparis tanakae]|uniref:Uncharacterized protein n=1 Tax=Liparis tanakae TaxID=230148 RepID=A0A4Z2FA41_9TELE|nr:hypothetical protein EYF80_052200 [Liparis tanakae]